MDRKVEVGLGGETGGTEREDDETGGTGIEEEIGGNGLVVGNGGKTVVLKTGDEGLSVGRLSVGSPLAELENDGEGIIGFDEEIDGIGRVVEKGGRIVVVLERVDDGLTAGMLSEGRLRLGRLNVEIEGDGGMGLVVGKGGLNVVLKEGCEGVIVGILNVGRFSVGRLNVGRLNVGRLNDGRLRVGSGLEDEKGGTGSVVGRDGTRVELTTGGRGLLVEKDGRRVELTVGGMDPVVDKGGANVEFITGGRGLVVGNGGASVELATGGRDLVVGREGTSVELMIGGRGLVVGKGGRNVELAIGSDGLTVGRLRLGAPVALVGSGGGGLSVGKVYVGNPPVELKIGGGGDGRTVDRVNVGTGGRTVIGSVAERRVVELNTGAVGTNVGRLRDGSDKLVGSMGEIEGKSVSEMFALGSGVVNDDGRTTDRDGRDTVIGPAVEVGVVLDREMLALGISGGNGGTVGDETMDDEGTESVGSPID